MTHVTATLPGRALRPARALRRACALLPVLAALGVVALAGNPASAAAATARAAPQTPTLDPIAASRAGLHGFTGDWDHVRQVIGWLRYRRPPKHVVYLLGGSASRESIRTEASWGRSLSARTGKRVAAWVLSSNCQTFVEDARIVSALPKGRGVALISVGMTRFNMVHLPASVPTRGVRTRPPDVWWEHHYDNRLPLSLAAKRDRVQSWLADRLKTFTGRYPARLAELDTLIQTCLARGIRPVLLEQPLNMAAAGHDLDAVLETYRQGSADLAAEYGIPYLDFVDKLDLPSDDFYDLWHLLKAGRARWQNRLCRELVYRGLY